MKNFLKNNKFFLLGFLILFWIILINLFPKGYVFGGGDTVQFINLKENFEKLIYDWNGSAAFFYFIFYILDKIGLSYTTQLSFHLAFILFGAYISFWLFTQLLFKQVYDLKKTLISLFYALNLYTLFLFTGNWGYSYFPSLYVFIPILIGLFIKFLNTEKFIYGVIFTLVIFLASSGFGNVAFALSFSLLLLATTFSLVLFKYVKINRLLFEKIILMVILSISVSSLWLMPILPQVQKGVEALNTTNILDFDLWLRAAASPIWNTLSLNHFSSDHFPLNFYYKNFDQWKNIFILISFLPIFLIIWGLFRYNKLESKKIFAALLLVLIIFTLLAARITEPFEIINYYVFHIWGFNVLRGFDKTAIYIPFLLSALMLIFVKEIKIKKWHLLIFLMILIAPLPFYIGKIQQNSGQRVNSSNDYKKAKMSFLIQIPNEYYGIKKIVDTDPEKSFIGILPATRQDGSGIIDYPKWKLYGADITYYLYGKKFIYQNYQYFSDWNFSKELNRDYSGNYQWLVNVLSMMNSRYIIYHKDATEDLVRTTEYKMRILESEGLIKNLEENNYFIFYKIPDDYFIPYITWQKENIEIQPNIRSINSNFDKVKSSTSSADFKEINPKKYEINFTNADNYIILSEKFDRLWKAYYITNTGKEIEIKDHVLARGYANGWKINPEVSAQKIVIEYYPTRLMWRGIWISGITVLLLLIYLVKYYIRNTSYGKRTNEKNLQKA
jgi:hypothetical protein